jgi:lipopolysaccharide transport system permease protein
MNFLAGPFVQLAKHHRMLLRTSAVELRTLYAGSLLGVLWVLVGPTLLLMLYALMFTVVLRVKPDAMSAGEYLMYMFSGLIPLLAFSASMMAGANVLSKNRQILLNTVFPSELLPVRGVLVASAVLPVGLCIIVLVDAVVGKVNWTLVLVPVVLVLQVMFTCGVAWILSLAALALRDMQMLIQYVTMALLFLSPVAFTPEMTPPQLKLLMYANPLFYYVNSFQSLIVFDRLPSTEVALTCIALSAITFALGFWIFQRAKQTFYDYV